MDLAAYKDYVNNLKEFAHINEDMNVFAYDNMKIGEDFDPESQL